MASIERGDTWPKGRRDVHNLALTVSAGHQLCGHNEATHLCTDVKQPSESHEWKFNLELWTFRTICFVLHTVQSSTYCTQQGYQISRALHV